MALDPNVRAFLEEQRFAVLATINSDSTPQLTVMWYELRGDTIVMNTRLSRVKGRNLQRDPRISVCVEDGERFVTVSGTATLNDDPATAQADIRALAIRYDGEEEGAREAEETFSKQDRVSIYLPISRVITKDL
ncbi:MAG TPA: PPOX class F420-dependent oxidoreductase [Ktedonobacterales bacterium]|jgi:PPOX class probable F420-dependent enzyme|nr:PPOX class F420-dependent oxidoreductase [Ktedonobacterales bacterium]HEX5571934.1 PPOX class F420-dependent oxidoreductase [Ktedonobacterales bacterium]